MSAPEQNGDRVMDALLRRAAIEDRAQVSASTSQFASKLRERLNEPAPAVVVEMSNHRRRMRTVWRVAALAAALMVVVALPPVRGVLRNAWRGATTDFGTVSWAQGGPRSQINLASGSVIDAQKDGATLVSLDGNRVSAWVGPESKAGLESRTLLRLESGEVWCDVVTNSGPFAVDTAMGTVHVTGTSFGVKLIDGKMIVTLERGSVDFVNASGSVSLSAGQCAEVTSASAMPQVLTDQKAARPEWLQAAMKDAMRDHAAKHYPSGMPGGK